MRAIDGDALERILSNAIGMMESVTKSLDMEDDKEFQMEIKAYTDILNGVKEQPTIEPERKKGKWIDNRTTCSVCGWQMIDDILQSPNMLFFPFCPMCGADMRGEENG